jgi:hypothetical protein
MADYIDAMVAFVPKALVSAAALGRIRTIARELPALGMGGFECRLGARRSRVDFHVGVLGAPALSVPAPGRVPPGWQFLEAFCRGWADRDSLLHRAVANLILEFDVQRRAAAVPVPAVFVALEPAAARDLPEILDMVVCGLALPRASALRAPVRRCLDGLPAGAHVTSVGAMVSRSPAVVRLNVGGIAPGLLSGYLQRIGWAGSASKLDAAVGGVAAHVDSIECAVDLSGVVCSRIGLECFLRRQPIDEPRWKGLLGHLVAARLCSPAKREALLSWPGFVQRASRPDAWPDGLTMSELFMKHRARGVFVRRLNHVKLVCERGRPVEAKAYLGFGHHWIDRAWTDPRAPRS